MTRSSRTNILRHTPLIFGLGILGLYSLDSVAVWLADHSPAVQTQVLFRLLPFSLLALLVQVVIWLRMAARRYGRRKTALGSLAVLLLVAGLDLGFDLHARRGARLREIMSSPDLYGAVGYQETAFLVSPAEEWLVCALADSAYAGATRIAILDLGSGEQRTVDFSDVPSDSRRPPVDDVAQALGAGRWLGEIVRFPAGRQRWIDIDPRTGRARVSSSVAAVPVQPTAGERDAYIKRLCGLHPVTVAVAWDGQTFGTRAYVAGNVDLPYRGFGGIDCIDVTTPRHRITSHRDPLADWSVDTPVVSPDGRLLAYTATRDPLWQLWLMTAIPLFALGGSTHSEYLFACDTVTGRRYRLGGVDDVSSVQWSHDSRSLYYASLNPHGRPRIMTRRFAIDPEPSGEPRVAWEPQPKARPQAPRRAGQTSGWNQYRLGEITFLYPGRQVTASERNGVVSLRHEIAVHHRNNGDSAFEQDRLADFAMDIELSSRSLEELEPDGVRRRRRPGWLPGGGPLGSDLQVVTGEPGCGNSRWYAPLGERGTLVVTFQLPWQPSRADPHADKYLALDGHIDWREAYRVCHLVNESITVGYPVAAQESRASLVMRSADDAGASTAAARPHRVREVQARSGPARW